MKSDLFSSPNPYFKMPSYDVICPYCGKKEVVKTRKTRNIQKKKCRGCEKIYIVNMSLLNPVAEAMK